MDQFIHTASGREYQLSGDLSATPVDIHDIAHGLSLINRFTGHTSRPYSVAEHSLLVLEIARAAGASRQEQLAALMHDAHEAYVGDLASPAKCVVGSAWRDYEAAHERRVHEFFGIADIMQAAKEKVRHWDLVALATEQRDVMTYNAQSHKPWQGLMRDGVPIGPSGFDLTRPHRLIRSWTEWRTDFVVEFQCLSKGLGRPV